MHRILQYTIGVSLLLAPLGWADDDHGKGEAKGRIKKTTSKSATRVGEPIFSKLKS